MMKVFILAIVMEKIRDGELTLNNVDLGFLKGQTDTECIPAVLHDATIAHETGELAGLYHDGGVIYASGKDIIMVIMT